MVPFSCYGGVNHQYIVSVLRSPYVTNIVNAASYGVKMPRVGKDIMENLIIPFPPLAEQKRIADTIQKYLAEIEQLEKDEEALAELQKAFPGKMKASILQQAIQGKLTDQRKEDGNAQDLYNQIQEEKQKLIKEKKIKKTKSLPKIEDDEIPFEIPENWMWVRLEDIIYTIGSKRNQIKEKEVLPKGIYKVVSQSKEPVIGYCNDQSKVLHIEKDCIVFGDHTALVKYINFDFVVGAAGVKVWKTYSGIETKFLLFALKFYLQGISNRGGYSRHYKFIKDKLIPLPPLAEQKRIVEKLDNLLPLCEA